MGSATHLRALSSDLDQRMDEARRVESFDVEVVVSSPDTCGYVRVKSDTFWVPFLEIEKRLLTHHHEGHSQQVPEGALKAAFFDYMEFNQRTSAEAFRRDYVHVAKVARRRRKGSRLYFDADGRHAWVPAELVDGPMRRSVWDHFLKVAPEADLRSPELIKAMQEEKQDYEERKARCPWLYPPY